MSDTINEFIKMTATQAVARLRSKEVSPLELVEASIEPVSYTHLTLPTIYSV